MAEVGFLRGAVETRLPAQLPVMVARQPNVTM
jgi:hypothetical protein